MLCPLTRESSDIVQRYYDGTSGRFVTQLTSGAIGKTRDPKAARWSLYKAGHIGTVVGTYGNVQVVPPLCCALDGR
jgi:uncharacterized membrane protein